MQSVSCDPCFWGSDEADGYIYCYTDQNRHEKDDACAFYRELNRFDPSTGLLWEKQDEPAS